MPTYAPDPLHLTVLRCEACGEALGPAGGADPGEPLTADQARSWWPELAGVMDLQERSCPAAVESREAGPVPVSLLVDETLARLKAAGWSIGETGTGNAWLVSGTNGENRIEAQGRTQGEAWKRALEQAKAVGMGGRFPASEEE